MSSHLPVDLGLLHLSRWLPENVTVEEGHVMPLCHRVDTCIYSLPSILSSRNGSLVFPEVPVLLHRPACGLGAADAITHSRNLAYQRVMSPLAVGIGLGVGV